MEIKRIRESETGHEYLVVVDNDKVRLQVRKHNINLYRVKFYPSIRRFGLRWGWLMDRGANSLLIHPGLYERCLMNRITLSILLDRLEEIKLQVVSMEDLLAAFAEGESNAGSNTQETHPAGEGDSQDKVGGDIRTTSQGTSEESSASGTLRSAKRTWYPTQT